ncbi:hypothetical protein BC939DRAFT_49802 [Gamsiella multidivaricata]|uniref:uncharacterized protein n=1 Tax=Gamsiella multidivaricata TaxID=101098 RepID=UPI00221F0A55|nr:uncharacterized protein BC939DRAFT_49802 [Gamsiella multidivaricata]KAI7828764.1 hypothetical protein BC939DRAFT_49802 [Gamsiella multidivaricata]
MSSITGYAAPYSPSSRMPSLRWYAPQPPLPAMSPRPHCRQCWVGDPVATHRNHAYPRGNGHYPCPALQQHTVFTWTMANLVNMKLQAQSGRKAFSRVLWKEKQLEQYERYRRSCDIVSLELEMLLNDTMLGQQDLWDEDLSFMPGSTPAALSDNVSNAPSMSPQSASSLGQEAPLTSMPSAPRKERMPRTPGSKAERLQRSYQALLLSPQVRARQLQRQRLQHNDDQDHTFQPILHEQHQSLISFPSPSHSTRKRPHRQYKSTGVGASRPHSILVQLYGLWKQTWLRQRIMHVLTESLELMLILWVVLKLTEVSLSWMGIRMLKSPNSSGDSINNSASGRVPWLTYFYGDREGAGSAAKELYARIRRDGLRLREMRIWRQREREQLMREMVASEKAMGMQRTPFTPAAMVWAPAGRLLAQAVSGLTLAYLSDYAKQLIKKL